MKKTLLLALILCSFINENYAQEYHPPLDFRLLLSGTFGELRNNHFHTGIDLKTKGVEGQKVYSIEEGFVSRIKVSTWGYGKTIYIDHPDGRTSVYAHLKKFNEKIEEYVKNKQYEKKTFEIQLFPDKELLKVKRGEIIAFSGNSGSSRGAHLHFEVRDSKTEKPINPLALGFSVKDNIKPIIKELKIYQIDSNSSKSFECINSGNQYSIRENLSLSGKIGIGIYTYDKSDDAYNKNGVYRIKLLVNQYLIYHFEADHLDFNTNRYINAHIDYKEKKKNKKKFHRCYKLPLNKLKNYKTLIDNGIFEVETDSIYDIKILVSDILGNESEINFKIKGKKIIEKEKNQQHIKKTFSFNQPNIFRSKGFQLHMEKNSLYNNINFIYEHRDSIDGIFGKIHQCHFDIEPVHKNYIISIDANIPDSLDKKVYIAKIDEKQNFIYKGGKWNQGMLSAKVKEFGDFCIIADTIDPIIKGINIYPGKIITSADAIKCTIEDKGSGIKSYNGFIDETWILMEYDHKKKLVWYDIDSSIKSGKHQFKLVVSDNVGNQTIYTADFER